MRFQWIRGCCWSNYAWVAGGEKKPADTIHVAVDTSTSSTSTLEHHHYACRDQFGSVAPITGAIHEVKMVGDAKATASSPRISRKSRRWRQVRSC